MRMVKQIPYEWDLLTREGSVLHYGRETLVKMAIEKECSHVMFIDTDMYFEGDAVERLVKRDKDVIGVSYNRRKFPLETTLSIHDKDGTVINEEKDGMLKCAGVATGFLLIKTDVFKKLKHPWFFWESDEEGELLTGEDVWFCRKAREAGYDIWADMTVKVGHVGEAVY